MAEKAKTEETKKKKGEDLQKKIEELNAKLAKEHDDYLRLMAEFETFRRRSAEERLALVGSASAETIKGLLPVLDDCERAIEQLEKTEASTFEKEGTGLIYNKLRSYVKSCGLEEMDVKGKEFDTDTAEAVAQLPVTRRVPGRNSRATPRDGFRTLRPSCSAAWDAPDQESGIRASCPWRSPDCRNT